MQCIPPGAFVGAYFGEMMTNEKAEHEDDTYLFDLDAARVTRDDDEDEHASLCVSALRYGNVMRFANHR